MKILCFVGEEDDDTRHVLAHQLANPPDDATVEFEDTDIVLVERDEQHVSSGTEHLGTIYTVGKAFYITLTKNDIGQITKMLTLAEALEAFKPEILNMVREFGGIDTVMTALETIVTKMCKDEGWL